MSDKLESPLLSDGHRPSPLISLGNYRQIIPYMAVILTILIVFIGFYFLYAGRKPIPTPPEIISLKNQTAILGDRVNQLEEMVKSRDTSSVDPDRMKQIEDRVLALSQQLEAIQNQPKADISPQQIERSQSLERDYNRLIETQNSLKSYILFWRLKTATLSNLPYRSELNDFKSVAKDFEGLSYLEKFADHGLQSLKTNDAQDIADNAPSNSWWDRFKVMIGSFVKIEKVGEQPTSSTMGQERQTIEAVLDQIEQSLIQRLNSTAANPTPQSGDAL